jgi:3-methylcrotonyl-CoA carboxylase alpha subunit
MRRALGEYVVTGLSTNLALLDKLLASPAVRAGDYDTTFVERELAALFATGTNGGLTDHVIAAAAAALAAERHANETAKPPAQSLSPWVAIERASRLEK